MVFAIACDVTNPLYGEIEASYVFAPQKGASAEDIKKMDFWMMSFADMGRLWTDWLYLRDSESPDYFIVVNRFHPTQTKRVKRI